MKKSLLLTLIVLFLNAFAVADGVPATKEAPTKQQPSPSKKTPAESKSPAVKSTPTPANTKEVNSRIPLEEIQQFAQVFDQIRRAYVEEVDDKTLINYAIKGLLSNLDPHSTYLDKDAFASLEETSQGEFGGLGIEVTMENGLLKIISPLDDSPAAKAGIEAGDLLIKLNDDLVQGMSMKEAVEKMRGPKGSKLRVTVVREGTSGPFELTIIRDLIKITSVRSKVLEPGYGYVRIAQFQGNTGKQFRDALTKLLAEKTPLNGLVLDLRNNPGGLLTASIEVVDAVQDGGMVVYTEGRIPRANEKHFAQKGDMLNGKPIVILINEGSASASEIVAGAMQDHKRAVLVGTNTFGKGSVQTVIPLDKTKGVKITTARYFTPGKRSIQASGIKPDILIEPAEIHKLKKRTSIKEKDLKGHLENDSKNTKKTTETFETDDNQLHEALVLLKGFHLLNQANSKDKYQTK